MPAMQWTAMTLGERFQTSVWKPLFTPNIDGAPSEHTPQRLCYLKFSHLKKSMTSTAFVFVSNTEQNKTLFSIGKVSAKHHKLKASRNICTFIKLNRRKTKLSILSIGNYLLFYVVCQITNPSPHSIIRKGYLLRLLFTFLPKYHFSHF